MTLTHSISATNNNEYIVTAWKGWSYGIRIFSKDVERFLRQVNGHYKVLIQLEDTNEMYEVKITPSFYRGCHELRGKVFTEYFKIKGITEWEKGKPPRLKLTYLGKHKDNNSPIFKVELLWP